MKVSTKGVIICMWAALIFSAQHVLGFESPSIYHSKILTASEKIIVLMKSNPKKYSSNNVISALTWLESQYTGEQQEVLSDIIMNVRNFSTCRTHGGERMSSHQECAYIDETTCTSLLKGSYDACASACRHMQTSICTMECVPVCTPA